MLTTVFKLLEQYGSPLYVYRYPVLKQRCQQMKDFADKLEKGLPKGIVVNMHYSTKANSNIAILSTVKEAGLNVDCMSPVELELDKRSGFTADRMLYVCNNISADEMKMVHQEGVMICLDSISQVKTWGKMFPGTHIMVRINPGTLGVGHSAKVITSGKKTKFGISEENIPLLLETAEKYNLHIKGTHQHLGSLFLNDKVSDYIAGIEAGLAIVGKYFKEVEIVDLGGGFGVPYRPEEEPLNLDYVAEKLLPVLNRFASSYPLVREFKFEPGRYIPCESGLLLGYVTAVKHENDTYWIGTDIGMNQLVRPSMYDSYHEVEVIHQSEEAGEPVIANFCGNICESGDILAKNRSVTLPEVGDAVIVYNSGAYGFSMASNYTGRERPAEVMLYEDSISKLIRKRESWIDLLINMS